MKITVKNDVDELNIFRDMITGEWGRIDPFEIECNGIKVPAPILAKKNGKIIGGVTFTWYKKPDGKDIGLWVNALYVMPSQRNKGIGSSLLKAASENVKLGYGLFASTNKPNLYKNCGWSILSQDSSNHVQQIRICCACRNISHC